MSKQRVYMASEANGTEQEQAASERFWHEPNGRAAVGEEAGQGDGDAWRCLREGLAWDGDTSALHRFRKRDYSPSLGRCVQQDPMGYVDGMSLYEYVGSGPVATTDPSGLFSGSNHDAITREAIRLSGLGYKNGADARIASGNTATDVLHLSNASYHAQDITFVSVVKEHMAELKKLDASNPKTRHLFRRFKLPRAQTLVGETMHVLQDVYAHTDWVDGRNMIRVYRHYQVKQVKDVAVMIWGWRPQWSDLGEADLIKRAEKNEPHGSGTFSLEKLDNGDSSDFANTILYTGGYAWWGSESLHNRYGTDDYNRGRAKAPRFGLGKEAFDNAYSGGLAITGEFLKWMEVNVEPCALKMIKRQI